jgi:rhodanese-related sulfurtransferase
MKTRLRSFKLVIGVLFCLALADGSQPSSRLAQSETSKNSGVAFISAEELKAKIASNEPLVIIDVRSSDTYAHSDQKIRGAVHVKLRRLEHRLSFVPLKDVPRDRQAVTYCSCPADEASITAARVLLENGFRNVRALKGGWREWLKVSGQTDKKPRL